MSQDYIKYPSQELLQDLDKCIHELLECDAFELQVHIDENGQTNYYLPYMMNDALECYFILIDCRMTGEYNSKNLDSSNEKKFGNFADFAEHSAVELIESSDYCALVIRQETGDIATIWFKDIEKELNCYRYHEIGHFWVKGEEHYRQLVYMIGTIYDKFEYMGKSICNDKELALLPLMDFSPFRYWSPIHESLDNRYPDTMEGIETFHNLCKESGDISLRKLAERYREVFQKALCLIEKAEYSSIYRFAFDLYEKFIFSKLTQKIAIELTRSGHEALYELIYQKVCDASSQYSSRNYGEIVNDMIASKRKEATESLISQGYNGKYPRFSKGTNSILITEEHPFTLSVLEYENYEFRLQFMVSETSEKACFLNQGFFEGTGNKGWIAKNINEL